MTFEITVEKEDWLENMTVQKRYEGDPSSLQRRRDEAVVIRRLVGRLDTRISAMEAREKAT